MKVAILAGGTGTRLIEETQLLPKPLLDIGGQPILWHIMKMYGQHGFNEFVILAGYKSYLIKQYFLDYFHNRSDLTINLTNNQVQIHRTDAEPWTVTIAETGLDTLTGGRLLRAKPYLQDAPFMLTYGDGVSDIDLTALVKFHRSHGKIATVTATHPHEGRYGVVNFNPDSKLISSFSEKPIGEGGFINGGFMVLQPEFFDYLQDGDATILERAPMEKLAKANQLCAFQHTGFWHCMDTLRDKQNLNKLWAEGKAPWRTWQGGERIIPLRDRAA